MKKRFQKNGIVYGLIIMVIFSACTKSPVQNLKLIVNYDKIKTNFGIRIVDARTGDQVGYADNSVIKVTLSGNDASKIIDGSGVKKSSYSPAKGFLGLAVDPGFTPTAGAPVSFMIVAECPGYVSTSLPIKVKKEGTYAYVIRMVNIAQPPTGVSAVTYDIPGVSNGIVPNTEVISTPVVPSSNTSAKMTIPANTLLKDAAGNPMNGTLHVNLVYFNNQDDASLGAFPGGLVVNNIVGPVSGGVFASAGFIAAEITDDMGTKVKTFSNNTVQFDMDVRSQTYNATAMRQIQDGDQIPLWSYDPQTGIWTQEGTQTITGPVSGNYTVSGNASHLSFWNWDWLFGSYNPFGAVLEFDDPNLDPAENFQLGAVGRDPVSNNFLFASTITAQTGTPYQVMNVPAGMPVDVTFLSIYGGSVQHSFPDLGSGNYTIDITSLFPSTQQTTVTVHLEGFCPDHPTLVVRPTLVYWYKNVTDNGDWQMGQMVNGTATLSGVVGKTIKFGVYYDGQWEEKDLDITSGGDLNLTGINFTQDICDQYF